jgi:hypothetical protein
MPNSAEAVMPRDRPATRSTLESPFKKCYGNFIGGEWVVPDDGKYFVNISPITGKPICEIPQLRQCGHLGR